MVHLFDLDLSSIEALHSSLLKTTQRVEELMKAGAVLQGHEDDLRYLYEQCYEWESQVFTDDLKIARKFEFFGLECPDCLAEDGSLHERGCELELCPSCQCCEELCECTTLNAKNAPDERRIPWDSAELEIIFYDGEVTANGE